MGWWSNIQFRTKALASRKRMEAELDEELEFHLERETQKHIARGLNPAEARRLATVSFGGVDRTKEQTRDSWGVRLVSDASQDVRFALRQFMKRPTTSALAVVTLGLGIGGTLAISSVVSSLLLRPLPYADDHELLNFWSDHDWRGVEFDHLRDRLTAFDDIAAYSLDGFSLRLDDRTSVVLSGVGSASMFEVLGAKPLLGRTFRPGEDRPGAEPVAVLGNRIWQRDFGSDPAAVGSRILLDGAPVTVVGVMPPDFFFPTPEADLWTPLALDPASGSYQSNGWLVLFGRARDGATGDDLQAQLDVFTAALGERFDYPDAWDKTRGAHFLPVREYLVGDTRPALLLLLGSVLLVLALACANVAALLVARSVDRVQEISVRLALGAGRVRLARQVLTESLVLAAAAGLIGTVGAAATFAGLVRMLPLPPGLDGTLTMDWQSFWLGLALALGTGTLVAMAPLRSLLRPASAPIGSGVRSSTGVAVAAGGAQRALVFAEVLLTVTLVCGATLLARSVAGLRQMDPGLDPAGVLAMDLLTTPEEMDETVRAQFFEDVLVQIAALPSVEATGLSNRLPIRDGGVQGSISVDDRPDLGGDQSPNSYYRTASPGFFRTMGMAIVKGRSFDEADTEGGLEVAIVNESFAERMWPGREPIGRGFQFNGFDGTETPLTVVGVVGDSRVQGLTGSMPMVAYRPIRQSAWGNTHGQLVVKTSGRPEALAPLLRTTIQRLDSRVGVTRVTTMDDVVDRAMSEPLKLRFFLWIFGSFGLMLGVVGVYGVVSYSVLRRDRELGVRAAMGAAPRKLMLSLLAGGMRPVALGTACGLIAAAALTRLLSGFLFGVAPSDPASFALAAVIILLGGALAALLPAWRASRRSPAVALRAG